MKVAPRTLWIASLFLSISRSETLENRELFARMNQIAAEMRQQPFVAVHHYEFDNGRFHQHAKLSIRVESSAGAKGIQVVVLRQEGSPAFRKRVLARIVADYQRSSLSWGHGSPWQITPASYVFEPAHTAAESHGCRLYSIRPRDGTAGTLEGKALVHLADSQVIEFEGHLTERPSLWVSRPELKQNYEKVGRFWQLRRTEGQANSTVLGTTHFQLDVQLITPPMDAEISHRQVPQ